MKGRSLVQNHVLRDHILIGGIAALMLSKVWSAPHCLIFWAATVLVDVDHYFNLLFWSKFRCFSIAGLFKFYGFIVDHKKRYPVFMAIEVFHTLEFVSLIFAGAYLLQIGFLKPVFWGIAFHVLVDFFHLMRVGALRCRKNSLLEFFILRYNHMRNGLDPTQVQKDAAMAALAIS